MDFLEMDLVNVMSTYQFQCIIGATCGQGIPDPMWVPYIPSEIPINEACSHSRETHLGFLASSRSLKIHLFVGIRQPTN